MNGSRRAFDEGEALDSAMEVFWRHGFQGSSLDVLCDAMGIGRRSLYIWLGDKRQLFIACLRHYRKTQFPEVANRMLADGADGRASILEFMKGAGSWAAIPNTKGCLLVSSLWEFAQTEPEIREVVDELLGELDQAFTKALERAVQQGEVRPDLCVATTASLLGLIRNGIMLEGKSGRSGRGIPAALRVVEELLEAA